MSTNELNMAVIGFDGVQLLMPQTSVATIEMIENLKPGDAAPGAIGFIHAGDREWPVYALDADLGISSQRGDNNRYCVAFDLGGKPAFALTCDAVSSLELGSVDEIEPLQACMEMPGSPLHALVMRDGAVMLASRVETMRRYLGADVEEAA